MQNSVAHLKAILDQIDEKGYYEVTPPPSRPAGWGGWQFLSPSEPWLARMETAVRDNAPEQDMPFGVLLNIRKVKPALPAVRELHDRISGLQAEGKEDEAWRLHSEYAKRGMLDPDNPYEVNKLVGKAPDVIVENEITMANGAREYATRITDDTHRPDYSDKTAITTIRTREPYTLKYNGGGERKGFGPLNIQNGLVAISPPKDIFIKQGEVSVRVPIPYGIDLTSAAGKAAKKLSEFSVNDVAALDAKQERPFRLSDCTDIPANLADRIAGLSHTEQRCGLRLYGSLAERQDGGTAPRHRLYPQISWRCPILPELANLRGSQGRLSDTHYPKRRCSGV